MTDQTGEWAKLLAPTIATFDEAIENDKVATWDGEGALAFRNVLLCMAHKLDVEIPAREEEFCQSQEKRERQVMATCIDLGYEIGIKRAAAAFYGESEEDRDIHERIMALLNKETRERAIVSYEHNETDVTDERDGGDGSDDS